MDQPFHLAGTIMTMSRDLILGRRLGLPRRQWNYMACQVTWRILPRQMKMTSLRQKSARMFGSEGQMRRQKGCGSGWTVLRLDPPLVMQIGTLASQTMLGMRTTHSFILILRDFRESGMTYLVAPNSASWWSTGLTPQPLQIFPAHEHF